MTYFDIFRYGDSDILRRMAYRYEVIERHVSFQTDLETTEERILGCFSDIDSARKFLRVAFDDFWGRYEFPSSCWLSECRPPEESPDDAFLETKFPEDGRVCYKIRRVIV